MVDDFVNLEDLPAQSSNMLIEIKFMFVCSFFLGKRTYWGENLCVEVRVSTLCCVMPKKL